MNGGEHLAPVGELEGDGNFTWIEVAVGTEEVGSDLRNERVEIGCTRCSSCGRAQEHRSFAKTAQGGQEWLCRGGGRSLVENQIRERIGVVREDPSKAGASGPVGGGLAIEAGAGV